GRARFEIAQRRHLEFAEIAVLERDVARAGRGRALRIVVVGAEQVGAVGEQLLDAAVPARVDLARTNEKTNAGIVEFAVGERRPDVAGVARAPADEKAESPLRGFGIARHRGPVAARERVAELVE